MHIYLKIHRGGRMVKLAETAPLPPAKRIEVHQWRGSHGARQSYLNSVRLGAWAASAGGLQSYRGLRLPELQRSDFTTAGEVAAAIEAHLQLIGGS